MKILVDMNLTPDWCGVLDGHGHSSDHWSQVGDPKADDLVLMDWALQRGYILFTHDLDLGTILAVTGARGPSVIQVRTQDVLPSAMAGTILELIRTYENELAAGAIVVVDRAKTRVRILPISRKPH